MREIQRLSPEKDFMRYKKGNLFDQTLYRLSKDINLEFRGNPNSVILYLEIALMSRSGYHFKEDGHILERLVEALTSRNYGGRVIKRALLLLMKYDAEPKLINRLLEHNPKMQ